MTIIASADGSALGNPGPAGWAWYIDPTSWRAGGWAHGTNNMGELTAVLNLLESTRHRGDEPLTVYCDSQYVINSVTKWLPGWKKKGWKKRDGKPVLNVDIMKALDRELSGRTVRFEWVKGHAGHELNEAADERARAMATAYQSGTPERDMPVGPGFRDDAGGADAHTGAATHGVAAGRAAARAEDSASARTAGNGDGPTPAGRPQPDLASSTPGVTPSAASADQPDLFSELRDMSATASDGAGDNQDAAGTEHLPPHFLAGAVQRETAAVCVPATSSTTGTSGAASGCAGRQEEHPHADVLHPDLLCIDERGATAPAGRFPCRADAPGARGATSAAGAPSEVRVIALGANAYHLSYRLAESARVTRRSSVWVREDQHNEMGPWLLRFHQVTAED